MAQDVEGMLYSDHCEIVAVADASSEGGSEEERSQQLLQVAWSSQERLGQRQGDDLSVAHICKRHEPIVVHVDANVKVEGAGVG